MPDSLDQALDDLRRALTACLSSWLPGHGWGEIEELVAQAETLLAGSDTAAVRAAVGSLLSATPARASKRISGTEPPPPRIRERINVLIDRIDARLDAEAGSEAASQPAEPPSHGR